MKILTSLFIISLVLIFFACGSDEKSLLGLYESKHGHYESYKITLMEGRAFTAKAPNGVRFSGTYTIEGKTIQCEYGKGKEIFQIVNDTTLYTTLQGKEIKLFKQVETRNH